MVVRQRATLLLGGLISVSNVGCAAVNALVGVGDAVPADRQTSAERMVAIARVFENQGRFERAESLYQQATRLAPEDPVIRQQLAQLASRREVLEFQADSMRQAVAQADAVSRRPRTAANRQNDPAPAYPSLEQVLMPFPSEISGRVTQSVGNPAETAGDLTVTAPAPPISEVLVETLDVTAVTDAEPMSAPMQALRQAAENSPDRLQAATGIVPASMEDTEPDATLWLKVLAEGSDLNTRVLAASMLGDCDVRNRDITVALSQQLEQATDHELILAIADSQQHRRESTPRTAERISEVAVSGSPEQQVQAVAALRTFVATSSESQCVMTLHQLLDSDSGSVRAAAAVAMGDHTVTNPETLVVLTQLAAEDPDTDVRQAARTALARRHPGTRETASAVRVH